MATTQTRHREPATVRIAMWSSRHRWPVAAAGSSPRSACSSSAASRGGIRADDPNGNPNQAQTESAKAYAVFDRAARGRRPRTSRSSSRHPKLQGHRPGVRGVRRQADRHARGPDGHRGRRDRPGVRRASGSGAAPPQAGLGRPGPEPPSGSSRRSTATRRRSTRHLVPVRAAIARIEADDGRASTSTPQPDADERGHHEPDQQQPRPDVRHDRPDVHHPADHVRRVRGRRSCRSSWRSPRCSRRSASSASSARSSRRPARTRPSWSC